MVEPIDKNIKNPYQNLLLNLPADWPKKCVAEIGVVIGGGTPSRDVPTFWNGKIPWVTPGEVSGDSKKYLTTTHEYISAAGLASSGAKLLPAGSLMITTRATLGARAINAVPMATNQGFKSIVFRRPQDAGFYFHFFDRVRPELTRRASGTTFLEISGSDFSDIVLPSPPEEEKQKIAEVLDTLDAAIAETESLIAKLKSAKQGLLHDLLTRGIDDHGELRPAREEAPEVYKRTPAGWNPKEWQSTELGACTSWFSGGTPSRAVVSNWTGSVPLLMPKDMKSFLLSDTSEHVTEKAAKIGSRLMPEATVFIVVRGMILAHSFPVVLSLGRMAFNQDVKGVVPGGCLDSRFLAYWFVANADFFLRRVTEATHGTKKLEMSALLGAPIGLPDLKEQIAIVERLAAVDERSDGEKKKLAQLRKLKSGLMDDLLTGRKRVTALLAGLSS